MAIGPSVNELPQGTVDARGPVVLGYSYYVPTRSWHVRAALTYSKVAIGDNGLFTAVTIIISDH